MPMMQTRRGFLAALAAAGAAGVAHVPPVLGAEGVLETTAIRLAKPGLCGAPQFVAAELLRAEGFTDIRYVDVPPGAVEPMARGDVDFQLNYAPAYVRDLDTRQAVTILAGVMVGCFELFANDRVHSIADLKGKSVGVQAVGTLGLWLMMLIAAEVGLDPRKDIRWVADPAAKPKDLFIDGKIDAFFGFSPEPQELRARHIGRVIVNSAADRPWSQYFCCLLGGRPEFVAQHPVATKRAVRAILKATDLCAVDPAGAARRVVDGRFATNYEYALRTLKDNAYDKWREYDAEDTVRFYALRMREVGFIKSSPNEIIASGTNWRFLDELKRELKA